MMVFKCVVVLIVLVAAVTARTTSTNLNEIPHEEARSSEPSSSYLGDLRSAYKIYEECAAADLSPCLKLKLVSAMDRAFRLYSEVPIIEGVKFVKETNAPPESNPKTEAEIEATLPRALSEKEDTLNGIITDKIVNFFDTHSLQVKFPTASDLQRSLNDEEGRKKKNKMGGGLLLIPLVLGGTLIPLVLGALALLAGKALIIAKLALILSGIIALKKLLGGGSGGGGHGHEVVVGDAHGGGPGWGRSYDKDGAQKLAYNAYTPQTTR